MPLLKKVREHPVWAALWIIISATITFLAGLITIWDKGREFALATSGSILGGAAMIHQGIWGIVGLLAAGVLIFGLYLLVVLHRDRNNRLAHAEDLAAECADLREKLAGVKGKLRESETEVSTLEDKIEQKQKGFDLLQDKYDSCWKRVYDLFTEHMLFRLAHDWESANRGLRIDIFWIESSEVPVSKRLKKHFKAQGWNARVKRSEEQEPERPSDEARVQIRCKDAAMLHNMLALFNNYDFGEGLRARGEAEDTMQIDVEMTIFPAA